MANGYAGKILVVDLSTSKISSLNTSDYEEWGGGHGMGSAIFFDMCKDKKIAAFDPANVVTLMTGPMQGMLVPFGGGRCEVQGIGAQAYPIEWFTRSNFGGRFAGHLKFAGWDGIVVTGKAERPVWLDIRDEDVQIRDASESGDRLWGLDTFETEKQIYKLVRGADGTDWTLYGGSRDDGRSTLNPGVVSCGPAGENLVRNAALVHEGGGGAGQGGFGAVFGSKNLKAISVMGTGSVEVADSGALMSARAWWQESMWDIQDLKPNLPGQANNRPGGAYSAGAAANVGQRLSGCLGCTKLCHGGRSATGLAPGSHCFDGYYTMLCGLKYGVTSDNALTTDRMQRLGLNAWELSIVLAWLNSLYKQGILGKGKTIDTDLPMEKLGTDEFNKVFLEAITYRTDIGADLAEGAARCAEKWGRYEEDTTSGILSIAAHGYAHHYDARAELEWGYGTALGERDINEHDITWALYWYTSMASLLGLEYVKTADEMVQMITKTLVPYKDPKMLDFSNEGMYSDGMVKLVSWHRAYTRFWKQSAMYCDWGMADWLNPYAKDYEGLTSQFEQRFYNAVTGKDLTFEDGIMLGKKIWNLDRAIWFLQGRTRDHDMLAEWQFRSDEQANHSSYEIPYVMTALVGDKWEYKNVWGRHFEHDKFEDFKDRYYAFEGWSAETGAPTRETLEGFGLGKVADELAASKVI